MADAKALGAQWGKYAVSTLDLLRQVPFNMGDYRSLIPQLEEQIRQLVENSSSRSWQDFEHYVSEVKQYYTFQAAEDRLLLLCNDVQEVPVKTCIERVAIQALRDAKLSQVNQAADALEKFITEN